MPRAETSFTGFRVIPVSISNWSHVHLISKICAYFFFVARVPFKFKWHYFLFFPSSPFVFNGRGCCKSSTSTLIIRFLKWNSKLFSIDLAFCYVSAVVCVCQLLITFFFSEFAMLTKRYKAFKRHLTVSKSHAVTLRNVFKFIKQVHLPFFFSK